MSDIEYYDRDGRPMTWEEYQNLYGHIDRNYKRVAETTVGESWVSTVWLGLDHQYGDGPPLIFETLVFDGPLADEMDRYSTESEALAGHERMVARVREAAAVGGAS